MNRSRLKLSLGLIFLLNLSINAVRAQVIEEFYVQEFPFKIDDFIYKYHQLKITIFNIKCTHYLKNKKWQCFNYTCTFKNDSILEIKDKKSVIRYIIRDKEFYHYEEIKKEIDTNLIKFTTPKNDVYVKHFDSMGFQCRNVYVIYKSDTFLETQHVTKSDSLNRIVFENYQTFGYYRHGVIIPDSYVKTYYSGDTTIHEYFRKIKNQWQPDYRYYYTCNKFEIKNKQLLEHKEDWYFKTIYFNNPSKNDEYAGREIIKYEYDNDGLEKRVIKTNQGLYFEGQGKVDRNESIVVTFTIIK